jgi:endonuclease-3 related protein
MMQDVLLEIFDRMFDHFGTQNWWPAETPFEVMLGAVLTQNTSWRNVTQAIENLKDVHALSLESILEMPSGLLAQYIRPAGYYNIKAARIGNLCRCIYSHGDGTVESFLQQPMDELRSQLLQVKGVGPETADSILLYAAHYPVFVVDTYTYRILQRHDLIEEETNYSELQSVFMDNLSEDTAFYNEYHALLVATGNRYCKKSKPDCAHCPLHGV